MIDQYKLNHKIIFRIECFGGLLINTVTNSDMVISKAVATFLMLLKQQNGNIHSALFKTIKTTGKFINVRKLVKQGIIEKTNISYPNQNDSPNELETAKLIWKTQTNYLSAPLELTIYPTLACNLHCKFCFIKNRNSSKYNELSANDWLQTIKEAKKNGIYSISILGGEPTIYYDINSLLLGIDQLEINTTLTTNGIYMHEKTKNILANAKYIIPVFSLQCLNSKNKILMGSDYEKTLTLLNFFIKKGKKVRINSVYTGQSYEDFFEIIDYCIKNNIDRYSIGYYININQNNDIGTGHSFDEVRKLDDTLKNYVTKKYGSSTTFFASVEGCMLFTGYPDYENDIKRITKYEKIYYGCRAGRTKMEIYSNGDVYPCICFENLITPTSNIKTTSLKKIWEEDFFMTKLRNSKASANECNNCGYKIICNGGCPAIKNQLYGAQFNKFKDPRCLLHE